MSFLNRNTPDRKNAAETESAAAEPVRTHPHATPSKATLGEPGSTSVTAMNQSDLPGYRPTTDVDKLEADAKAQDTQTEIETPADRRRAERRAAALREQERAAAERREAERARKARLAAQQREEQEAAERSDEGTEPTQVIDRDQLRPGHDRDREPITAEQPAVVDERPAGLSMAEPAERDRAAEREARQRALGVKARSEDPTDPIVTTRAKRTTDKWHGSLALTLLRLVAAAILGIRGFQHIRNISATEAYFQHSILPKPMYFAWGVGIAEIVIAVLLLVGLANRVAGLLTVIIEVGMLVLFIWGKVNPFSNDRIGFNGELELLLAAVGLLFLLLGSGGWGLDAMFRRKSARRKEDRELGNYA